MARREQDKMLEVGFCAEIPSSFSYLEEARNSFEYHWNGCIHFFQDVKERCPIYLGEWAESRRQEFEFTLRKWPSAFEGFLLLTKENLDNKGLQGANILRIRYIISRINLDLETLIASENEMVWDKHCAAFSEILSLAESTMILNSNQGDAAFNQKPGFALDMGFVGPLAAVACKCRHPTIRRRATTFLGSMPRQEGIWNSIVSAHVCKRIIEIEESGLSKIARCEDVPNWARVYNVELDFDLQHRRVTMRYERQGDPLSPTRLPLQERIEY